jgi:hypothetical protein
MVTPQGPVTSHVARSEPPARDERRSWLHHVHCDEIGGHVDRWPERTDTSRRTLMQLKTTTFNTMIISGA